MFQPFLEVLRNRLGVQNFTMQVSSNGELTQIIITPSLSAPAALPDAKGYSEKSQAYRAALTSPIIVRAPLSEIDTQLASIIEKYCTELTAVLSDSKVSALLKSAVDLAKTANQAAKKSESKQKPDAAKPQNSEADTEHDDEIPDPATAKNFGAGGIETDDDILASLGL